MTGARSLALLFIFVAAIPCQAEMLRLSLVAVGNSTTVAEKVTGVDLNADGVGFGAGALGEISVGNDMGIEVGLLYSHQKLKSASLLPIYVDATALQLPVLLRFWPIRYLSFGGGFYYTKYLSTSVSMSNTSTNSDVSGTDSGFVGSLMIRVPFLIGSLVADGRYYYGVHDEQVSNLQGLLGFMIGI